MLTNEHATQSINDVLNCSIETNKRIRFYNGMDHVGDPLAVVKIIQLGKKRTILNILSLEKVEQARKREKWKYFLNSLLLNVCDHMEWKLIL